MKNLLASLSFLFVFAIVGCQSDSVREDEIPEINSTVIEDDPQPVITFITVEFRTRGTDRQLIRNLFGPALGLALWGDCPTDPSLEVWTMPYMTEIEFQTIIGNVINSDINLSPVDTTEYTPGSSGTGPGADVPVSGVTARKKKSSQPGRPGEEYEIYDVYFFYGDLCD